MKENFFNFFSFILRLKTWKQVLKLRTILLNYICFNPETSNNSLFTRFRHCCRHYKTFWASVLPFLYYLTGMVQEKKKLQRNLNRLLQKTKFFPSGRPSKYGRRNTFEGEVLQICNNCALKSSTNAQSIRNGVTNTLKS